MEWIRVKDKTPPQNQMIRIKAEGDDEVCCEGIAIFTICDINKKHEAWKWAIKEGYNSTLSPTHWMLLPQVPNGMD